jgi:hypothetical protein
MDCWNEIRKLKGKTLKTLDQGNPFDVVDVTEHVVIVRPHKNEIERRVPREQIEDACKEMVTRGEITRVDIRANHTEFNPAYVAAILAQLPGVSHTIRPIRLRYQQGKSR